MINYMNTSMTYTPLDNKGHLIPGMPIGPTGVLRGTLIPSSRPGWNLIQTGDGLHASMLPNGQFQANSAGDGPYEQCLVRGNTLVFHPRYDTEDQLVGFVAL